MGGIAREAHVVVEMDLPQGLQCGGGGRPSLRLSPLRPLVFYVSRSDRTTEVGSFGWARVGATAGGDGCADRARLVRSAEGSGGAGQVATIAGRPPLPPHPHPLSPEVGA